MHLHPHTQMMYCDKPNALTCIHTYTMHYKAITYLIQYIMHLYAVIHTGIIPLQLSYIQYVYNSPTAGIYKCTIHLIFSCFPLHTISLGSALLRLLSWHL
ncbi:hypothetical protein FKM82_014844 [Ascaphus truei]